MAITSLTYVRVGPTRVQFTFASDLPSPTFYLYKNGEFVGTTQETTYVVSVYFDEQFRFDVFDDATSVPPEHFPSQVTLRWEGRGDESTFRVDQYVSGAWAAKDIIPARVSNLYHYYSQSLTDSTSHQFRVVPLSAEGLAGNALEFTVEMCRYPDDPTQTMTFVGGELSIT